MQDLLREIERAVKARGWSARQASLRAVGTPELISEMRRGRVPSVERIRSLCQVLDLEFYVGPPRDERPVDTERLERAFETTERVLALTGRSMRLAEKARVVSSVYDLIGEGRARVNARRVVSLIEAVASPSSARRRLSGELARGQGDGRPRRP